MIKYYKSRIFQNKLNNVHYENKVDIFDKEKNIKKVEIILKENLEKEIIKVFKEHSSSFL